MVKPFITQRDEPDSPPLRRAVGRRQPRGRRAAPRARLVFRRVRFALQGSPRACTSGALQGWQKAVHHAPDLNDLRPSQCTAHAPGDQ